MARIRGTRFGDSLQGTVEDDVIDGQAGDDLISGDAGNDVIKGGKGNDTLAGNAGADVVDGGDGLDLLVVEDSLDQLDGGAGNDEFVFFANNPSVPVSIDGGRGRDIIRFQGNVNTADVIAVTERVEVWVAHDGVTMDMTTLSSPVELIGSSSNLGNTNPTTVIGSNFGDAIQGGQGLDILRGGLGADSITGGEGDDQLEGGAGADTLNGNEGADDFVYRALSEGADTVVGFVPADDDIGISQSIPGASGPNEYVEGSNPAPTQANVFAILYDTDDGRVFFDPDGTSGGFGPTLMATLTGAPDLSSADFFFF